MSGRLSVILVLIVTAVLVALGVMSFKEGTARSRPVVVPFDMFWCEKDDDCVIVNRIGCCPCKQGGGQAAVTNWHRDDLRRLLKRACRPTQVCVQVNACQPGLQARCAERRCQMVHASE